VDVALSLRGGGTVTAYISRPEHKDPTVEAMASEFSAVLFDWVSGPQFEARHGPNLFDEIRRRNSREPSSRICHSHDFCDANMAMSAAFEHVLGREPNIHDGNGPDDSALWNAVWSLAWHRGFERHVVLEVPLEDWLADPTFGRDPASWQVLKPTEVELPRILVALDYFLETGKELR
jgi:hypothetical protein